MRLGWIFEGDRHLKSGNKRLACGIECQKPSQTDESSVRYGKEVLLVSLAHELGGYRIDDDLVTGTRAVPRAT